MWTTLVGLIERWWREKPRADVVRAVVGLRDEMINCQSWYRRAEQARREKKGEEAYPNPRVEWVRSLSALTSRVVELDSVLSIFSPEGHQAIASYRHAESLEVGASGLIEAASELGEDADFDLREVTMSRHFDEAIEQLRVFIAGNFKPEEIHAATQSKWR